MNAQRRLWLPRRGRVLVAGVALLALAGCNGGVAGLSAPATELLHERVAAVRAAADTEDRAAALAAVEAFKAEIQRLVEAGDLTESQAASLLAHADAIAADVRSEVAEPTPTPEPSPEPTPVATPSPEQVQVLQQDTADRLSEMLRERLTEYVEQRMEEREAEEKAAQQAEQARERAERKKARDAKRDRNRDEKRANHDGGSR